MNNKKNKYRSGKRFYSNNGGIRKKKVIVEYYNKEDFIREEELLAPVHNDRLTFEIYTDDDVSKIMVTDIFDEVIGKKSVKPGINKVVI